MDDNPLEGYSKKVDENFIISIILCIFVKT